LLPCRFRIRLGWSISYQHILRGRLVELKCRQIYSEGRNPPIKCCDLLYRSRDQVQQRSHKHGTSLVIHPSRRMSSGQHLNHNIYREYPGRVGSHHWRLADSLLRAYCRFPIHIQSPSGLRERSAHMGPSYPELKLALHRTLIRIDNDLSFNGTYCDVLIIINYLWLQ
jgi:hypothetical protein